MLHRGSRILATSMLVASILLAGTVATVSAAEEDATGSSTAQVTLLIVAAVGIVLVIAWMAINRLRTPPSD